MKNKIDLKLIYTTLLFVSSCGILNKTSKLKYKVHQFNNRFQNVMIIENFRNDEDLVLTNMFGGDWESFSFVKKNRKQNFLQYENSFENTFLTLEEAGVFKSMSNQFSITILNENKTILYSLPYLFYVNDSLYIRSFKPFFSTNFPIVKDDKLLIVIPYFMSNYEISVLNKDDSLVLQLKSSKEYYVNNAFYSLENFSINLSSTGQIDSNSIFKFDDRGFSLGNY